MQTFPSYAEIKFDGFGENRESALLRTEMESGPPKQARIKARVMVVRPVKIRLVSLADYLAFVDWFSIDINEGADWFNWTDPVRGTVKAARLVGGGLPAKPTAGTLGYWEITHSLETWG